MEKKLTKKAFTLIELLVVIAIISLLVSILLPSLNKARELARSAVCVSNLRSIGLGINMYTSNHEGQMPYFGQRHWNSAPVSGLVGGGLGWWWAGSLLADEIISLEEWKQYSCPSDTRSYELTEESFYMPQTNTVADFTDFSYSGILYGSGLAGRSVPWSWINVPVNIGEISNAGNIILVQDGPKPLSTSGAGWDTNYANIQSRLDGQIEPFYTWYLEGTFRHSGSPPNVNKGPNTLFVDAHAEQNIDFDELSDDNFTF